MAKKTKKLTTYKSSESVVTAEYMNSVFGGLYGTDKESLYTSVDPLVYGHVHDGEHLDGHAQKINLSKHVTGKLHVSMIEGTIESTASPGSPLNSFQFNSADTFGGASSFLYDNSTGNVQFSKDKKFYYGSSDNQNSYYIKHEINTSPELNFYSESTADTVLYKFRKDTTETIDLVMNFSGIEDVNLYGDSTSRLTRYHLGSSASPFSSWHNLYVKQIRMYHTTALTDSGWVQFNAKQNSEEYTLFFPAAKPSTSGQVLKTMNGGVGTINLTWDTVSSGGSHIPGLNINIINSNTVETKTDVVFNTVESGRYEVGGHYVYIEDDGASIMRFATSSTVQAELSSSAFYPYVDADLDLGLSSKAFGALYVDDILLDSNLVKTRTTTDLILQANSGTNGSVITLDYAADNTADVIVETKGKGYLKSPYKEVLSEGYDGTKNSRTAFLNNTVTSANRTSTVAALHFKVDPAIAYGAVNLDVVASKIDRLTSPNQIVDTAFSKNYIVISRAKSGVDVDVKLFHPQGHIFEGGSRVINFLGSGGAINNINYTIDSITGGTADVQSFNLILSYDDGGEGTNDSCDFTLTAKSTYINGINIYRP